MTQQSWTVGISTCLMREFSPERHVPLLAANGIAAMELTASHAPAVAADPGLRRSLARALEDSGVILYSVHVPFSRQLDVSSPNAADRQAALDTARRSLDLLAELDGRALVVHPSSEPIADEERPARLQRARESLAKIAEFVPPDSGIRLAVENLPRTCLCRDAAEHLSLLDSLEHPAFGVCLDVNHGNLREDLIEATRRYGDRIVTLHLSDNDGVDERHWLPGRGVIDWNGWLQALAETGYDGPLMYEVSPWLDGSSDETIAAMLRELRTNAREVLGA